MTKKAATKSTTRTASKKAAKGIPAWKQKVLARESTKAVIAKINKASKAKPIRATSLEAKYARRLALIAASCGVIQSETRDDVLVFYPN
jgi:hypothetical protein